MAEEFEWGVLLVAVVFIVAVFAVLWLSSGATWVDL